MARVTGIGGVFFTCKDPEKTVSWYREKLGLDIGEYGFCAFEWRSKDGVEAQTVWTPFPADTDYFGPSGSSVMINYTVDNLDEFLTELKAKGVRIDDERQEYDYGRFAWVYDDEGKKIELWEPRKA